MYKEDTPDPLFIERTLGERFSSIYVIIIMYLHLINIAIYKYTGMALKIYNIYER